MLVFAILKIIGGGLTVWMGRSTKKVFRPILKEYRDAERGITQGITMTKRRSKQMKFLKRKVCKITAMMCLVGFVTIVYTKNFMHGIIDQYVDQKYDYIQQNNATENSTYSVEKMRKELYNETAVPQEMVPIDDEPERQVDDSHFEPYGQPFGHQQPEQKNLGDNKKQHQPYRFGPPRFGNDSDDDEDDDDDFDMTESPFNQ